MNRKGYLGNFIFAFVMIGVTAMVMFAIFPVIQDQIGQAQMNISGTPSPISEDLVGMLNYVPWIFAASMGFIIFLVIWRAMSSDGVPDSSYEESDDENEDDSEEEIADEDEESEPEPETKKQHSTRVITKKKDGNVKTNITLSPTGYNVDKYELTKPTDTKLSLKEANFNKTKYD